jgi:hypothetical protein
MLPSTELMCEEPMLRRRSAAFAASSQSPLMVHRSWRQGTGTGAWSIMMRHLQVAVAVAELAVAVVVSERVAAGAERAHPTRARTRMAS